MCFPVSPEFESPRRRHNGLAPGENQGQNENVRLSRTDCSTLAGSSTGRVGVTGACDSGRRVGWDVSHCRAVRYGTDTDGDYLDTYERFLP